MPIDIGGAAAAGAGAVQDYMMQQAQLEHQKIMDNLAIATGKREQQRLQMEIQDKEKADLVKRAQSMGPGDIVDQKFAADLEKHGLSYLVPSLTAKQAIQNVEKNFATGASALGGGTVGGPNAAPAPLGANMPAANTAPVGTFPGTPQQQAGIRLGGMAAQGASMNAMAGEAIRSGQMSPAEYIRLEETRLGRRPPAAAKLQDKPGQIVRDEKGKIIYEGGLRFNPESGQYMMPGPGGQMVPVDESKNTVTQAMTASEKERASNDRHVTAILAEQGKMLTNIVAKSEADRVKLSGPEPFPPESREASFVDALATGKMTLDQASQGFSRFGKVDKMVFQKIIAEAMKKNPSLNFAQQKIDLSVGQAVQKGLAETLTSTEAFARTADENSKLLKDAMAKVPDAKAKFINAPLREVFRQFDPDMTQYDVFVASVRTEYSRLVNQAKMSSATIPIAIHDEFEKLMSGDLTLGQTLAALDAFRAEGQNRLKSTRTEYNESRKSTAGGVTGAPDASAIPPAQKRKPEDFKY